MKIGYIGYGEAAFALSQGLHEKGIRDQYTWSFEYLKTPEEAGVTRLASLAELLRVCDVAFVVAPASAALAIARSAAPFLDPHIIYADMSSAAPKLMEQVAAVIEPTGARFVDGALLDTVPRLREKVPIMVSGSGAQALLDMNREIGLNMGYAGEKPGAASAIKLFRSLYTKALLGLCFEMLEGAARYGVADFIMESLAATMDGKTFLEGMNGRICGGVIHAGRRAVELDSAADMLEDFGMRPMVARASAQKLRDIDALNLRAVLDGKKPADWKEAIGLVLSHG